MINKYLPNSIIIFDEAHNVGQVAEEGYSIKYTVSELKKTVEDFTKLKMLLNGSTDENVDF
jgi:Rad3-related DNA helicase